MPMTHKKFVRRNECEQVCGKSKNLDVISQVNILQELCSLILISVKYLFLCKRRAGLNFFEVEHD